MDNLNRLVNYIHGQINTLHDKIHALESRMNATAAVSFISPPSPRPVVISNAGIDIFGPSTRAVKIPPKACGLEITMCGGGSIGTLNLGGGGGASIFNMIVPLTDHAGLVLLRAGRGGQRDFVGGESSIVEIMTTTGKRQVYEVAPGVGALGGINEDLPILSGGNGFSYAGGGTSFSLPTKPASPGWIGAGGGPTKDAAIICDGGHGYVHIRFLTRDDNRDDTITSTCS